MRAALVSVNLFSLLCTGDNAVRTSQTGTILRYGGPILYLIIYSFILLGVLVWVDSGSIWPRFSLSLKRPSGPLEPQLGQDVVIEAEVASKSDDILRLLKVTKTYGDNSVVDDLSLGVPRDTVFAMLGPNGAGKTTTCNIIRESISELQSCTSANALDRW